MKILISFALLVLCGLSAFAQLDHTVPIVWLNHPLNRVVKPAVPLDLSSLSNNPLSFDASLPERLQHAFDSLYAKTSQYGKHGVSAAIIVPGQAMWTGSVGESYPGIPLTPQHLFEIASNTKTFTTAFIMQLAEEGKLSISDSLWKWLPKYTNIDSTITIKQLLEHSSGIYDYLNDDPNGTIIIDAYFYTPDKVWTSQEILEHFIGAPNFAPGTSYKYSNTNFLLLGLIAEKASGAEYGAEIHRRFIDPLGLTNTFLGWKDSVVGEFAHNWFDTLQNEPMMDLGLIDKTAQLSMAGPAGGNVSIPGDLAVWVKSLYQDTLLLSKNSRTQMMTTKTWPDGSRYGLGTSRVPFGSKAFYGHTGGLLGFYSDMFNNPKDSVTFVIYTNSGSFDGDVSLNDYAIALLTEIYRPVNSAVRGQVYSVTASVMPNPVSNVLKVNFSLPVDEHITFGLYDILGSKVATVAEGEFATGEHTAQLDVRDLPAGAYTYHFATLERTITGKVMVVR